VGSAQGSRGAGESQPARHSIDLYSQWFLMVLQWKYFGGGMVCGLLTCFACHGHAGDCGRAGGGARGDGFD
jgi:hypothetical protein